jgi:hypothetical protein
VADAMIEAVITIRGGDIMKKLWIVPVVFIVGLLGFTSQKDTYAGTARLRALLDGFHQVPPVHTEGKATFTGRINEDGTITFTLTYSGLTEPVHVQFADVHFGQEQNTGGILFFLCSNQATAPTQANPVSAPATGTDTDGVSRTGTQTLFNGPVDVPGFGTPDLPTCPDSGTVTGTLGPDAVVDAGAPGNRGAQGILAGELEKVLEAIRSGQTYVQVHTNAFPAGELRRQVWITEENN